MKNEYSKLDKEDLISKIDELESQLSLLELLHNQQESLKESEQRLSLAIQTTGLGLWNQDFNTGKVFRTKQWYDMLGYKESEVTGNFEFWKKIIHPDDMPEVKKEIELHESGNSELFMVEHRLKCNNDEYKWIRNWGKIIERGENGEPIKAIGVHLDIDTQKKAQLKIIESEEKFRTIFNNINDPVIIHDLKGNLLECNDISLNKYGYTRKEFKTIKITDLYVNNIDAKSDNLLNKLTSGKPFFAKSEHKTKSGDILAVETQSKTINHLGQEAVLTVIRDISERKKLENQDKKYSKKLEKDVKKRTQELATQTKKLVDSQAALTFLLEDVNESRAELLHVNKNLEGANLELESFSYTVSHDLRAPLRHIDGFAKLLEKKLKDEPSEVMKYFNKIYNASSHMHSLINDLLTFSRLGRRYLKKSYIDLGSLIEELLIKYEPDNKQRNIEWELGELEGITGDYDMLRIAFDNLISNALKFTSQNEKAIIKITSKEIDNKHIQIVVKDNGVGFEMEYVEKIFGVFERLHDSGQFPGTGIGLANVKKIVDSHMGTITAVGAPGKGATFTLLFPVIEPDSLDEIIY